MFWYILGIICLVALIIGIIIANKSYDYDWIGIALSTIGGFILIVLICVVPIVSYTDKQNVNTFCKQKEYIESHIVEEPIENAALTNTKIGLNNWLINAQYAKENYPLLTFLPDEIMELTPIN